MVDISKKSVQFPTTLLLQKFNSQQPIHTHRLSTKLRPRRNATSQANITHDLQLCRQPIRTIDTPHEQPFGGPRCTIPTGHSNAPTHSRYQLPRSPKISITLASRLQPFSQLVESACSSRSGSPSTSAAIISSCSLTETCSSLMIELAYSRQ